MQPAQFDIEQLIWAPPLPVIFGILLLSGLICVGRKAVLLIFPGADQLSRLSAPFYGAMIAGAIVQLLACAGWATLDVVRLLATILAAAGAAGLVWVFARGGGFIGWQGKFRLPSHRWTLVAGLSAAVLLFELLLSVAPITDADSLNYHLGSGVLMLRTGSIGMLPDWFSSHLSGLGEMVSAIGLAFGTDSFGSLLQFCGLAVIVLTIAKTAKAAPSGLLSASAVLAMPLCVPLVASAKPQLFPAAGLAVAAAILSRMPQQFELRPALLVCGLLIFAVANKYSFAIPVFVLGCWLAIRCRSPRHIGALAAASTVMGATLLVPLLVFRWSHFGDPVSPMLADFVRNPIPGAHFWLSTVKSAGNGLPQGLNLFVPADLGGITAVFLYSPLILVAAVARGGTSNGLIWAAICCFGLDLGFTQQAARFFLDPVLWLAVAVAQQTARPAWSPVWAAAIVPQLALTASVAAFGVWNLTPGAFSENLRDRTLTNSSYHYAAMRWLDGVLPRNAVLLLMSNQIALSPRMTMASDGVAANFRDPKSAFVYYKALAISRGITHAVVFRDRGYDPGAPAGALTPCLDRLMSGPRQFTRSTRNPFNRSSYTVEVWAMNFHKC